MAAIRNNLSFGYHGLFGYIANPAFSFWFISIHYIVKRRTRRSRSQWSDSTGSRKRAASASPTWRRSRSCRCWRFWRFQWHQANGSCGGTCERCTQWWARSARTRTSHRWAGGARRQRPAKRPRESGTKEEKKKLINHQKCCFLKNKNKSALFKNQKKA